MDIYSLHRLAHTEHELRMKSLPAVSDYEHSTATEQLRWSSRLFASLRTIGTHFQTSRRNRPAESRPALTMSNPSPFLRDQFREDSVYEMDWLWASTQVTAPEEVRYCLERALYINPDNPVTERELSKLSVRRADVGETIEVNEQDFAHASSNN